MKQILHTPDGVRDIYNEECSKKIKIQDALHHTMHLFGYKDIQTPTFEYFEVFSREIGTVPSKELYKFFDKEGSTLVLRPDITPSIARAASKYFVSEDMPIRLCYMGNTFINNANFQGRLKETTQIGAELIGDSSVDADAEMIAMVIESLLKAGLREFQVSIGHIEFFKSLLRESGIGEEKEIELRNLISRKNNFGIEELLSTEDISEELKKAFLKTPELFGSIEILTEAKTLTSNQDAVDSIERLEALYEVLCAYGVEKYVSFDLGIVSKYKYYTGIIFRAYTYGTGEPIVKGGRYDTLLEHFGKKSPSVGFAIVVDQLLNAMSRQGIEIKLENHNTLLLYTAANQKAAIEYALKLREEGTNIELIKMKEDKTKADYVAFAKRCNTDCVLYFENDKIVEEKL